jgi:hypothetical protein
MLSSSLGALTQFKVKFENLTAITTLTNSMNLTVGYLVKNLSHLLWNPIIPYILLLYSILSQLNPVHTLTQFSLRCTLILLFHLGLGLQSGLFFSGFPTKILHVFISTVSATCPTYLILLDVIILIIFCEEYKL